MPFLGTLAADLSAGHLRTPITLQLALADFLLPDDLVMPSLQCLLPQAGSCESVVHTRCVMIKHAVRYAVMNRQIQLWQYRLTCRSYRNQFTITLTERDIDQLH